MNKKELKEDMNRAALVSISSITVSFVLLLGFIFDLSTALPQRLMLAVFVIGIAILSTNKLGYIVRSLEEIEKDDSN